MREARYDTLTGTQMGDNYLTGLRNIAVYYLIHTSATQSDTQSVPYHTQPPTRTNTTQIQRELAAPNDPSTADHQHPQIADTKTRRSSHLPSYPSFFCLPAGSVSPPRTRTSHTPHVIRIRVRHTFPAPPSQKQPCLQLKVWRPPLENARKASSASSKIPLPSREK